MKQKYTYMVMCALVLLLGFSACDKDAHENEYPVPDGRGGLIIGLETEGGTAEDVHFFVFDASERLAHHEYFDNPQKAALYISYLTPSIYTAVAVFNTGADFMPPSTRAVESLSDITLPEFAEWLKSVAHLYPELLTGIGSVEVIEGEVARITIRLQDGTDGVRLPKLNLLLTLPEPHLPDYTPVKKSRAAETGYTLRCVAELCKAGTDNVMLHKAVTPALQANGTYLVDLEATPNSYDLRLWTDYAPTSSPQEYTYYNTGNLRAITLTTEPAYTANTDAKDAAYACHTTIDLSAGDRTVNVQLQRPLAKYRLIATDVEEYNKLRATDETKFPPVDELTVTVQYENYFPASFNAVTGKPNDSYTGIAYTGCLTDAEGFDTTTALQAGSDWVLTNGTESFVTATVKITDRTGSTVTATGNVRIPYRRGQLTTVKGNFLSSGHAGGGVQIDTEWEDDIIIRF